MKRLKKKKKMMCDSCNGPYENDEGYVCSYWLHEIRWYGRCIQFQSYCKGCTKIFRLFDGREEYVCLKCQKYVEQFLKQPALLDFFLNIKNEDQKTFLEHQLGKLGEENIVLFIKFLEDPNEQEISDQIVEETTKILFGEEQK